MVVNCTVSLGGQFNTAFLPAPGWTLYAVQVQVQELVLSNETQVSDLMWHESGNAFHKIFLQEHVMHVKQVVSSCSRT